MRKKRFPRVLRVSLGILGIAVIVISCVFSALSRADSASPSDDLPDARDAASFGGVSPSPTAIPTASPTPATTSEPGPEYFTISLIGDCTLASTHGIRGTSWSYERVVGDNYAYPFANTLKYFENDDFTIANLECVLSEYNVPVEKAFNFRADPAYVNILLEGSVEYVNIANNHTMDYGSIAYDETKDVLESAGIGYTEHDEYAVYTTQSGLRIGVYSAGFGVSSPQVVSGVQALGDAGAEYIIVAIHWGEEGRYTHNNTQTYLAHAAIDAGADLIYGTHPHVLQPVEEYKGKYIYYSLGNWTFGGNTMPRDTDSVIVQLTLMRDTDGSITVASRTHIPCSISGTSPVNNYQPVALEKDTDGYKRVLSKLDGSYAGPDLAVDYTDDTPEETGDDMPDDADSDGDGDGDGDGTDTGGEQLGTAPDPDQSVTDDADTGLFPDIDPSSDPGGNSETPAQDADAGS